MVDTEIIANTSESSSYAVDHDLDEAPKPCREPRRSSITESTMLEVMESSLDHAVEEEPELANSQAESFHVTFLQTLSSWLPGGNSKGPNAMDSWSSTFILVNFISIGYILNPAAFAQGGTLLGSVCLAFVSLQSMITGIYILEACTRAEMLKVSTSVVGDFGSFYSTHELFSESICHTDPALNENVLQEPPSGQQRRYLPRYHSLRVHQRTYELSELCRIFLGRGARNFFTLTALGDLYGVTWALAAVFGSSLAENIPLGFGGDWDYMTYIFIFMAFTVPASCVRITVQMPIQLLFLFARTIMLLLMLGTLCAAYASKEPHFGTHLRLPRETPLANWSAIVTVLQTAMFSTAYQFSVPGLTAETANKGAMSKIISGSVGYIFVTNLILSILMATYFGAATQGSSNLNWIDYHGGTWDGESELTRSWWATAISSYVVLFAAIDGLAVYPLIAMSLGDISMGVVYEEKVHSVQEKWRIRTAFRLSASIPQACGALFLKDLGVIAKYAGIFTLLSYTICPAILAIRSRYFVQRVGLPSDTKYKTLFSNEYIAYSLILISTCLIIGVFADALLELSNVLAQKSMDDDSI